MNLSGPFAPAAVPFMAAKPMAEAESPGAVLFGAPHATPYDGIDNRPFAPAANALRLALAEDGRWADHWDFDLDGPPLGEAGFMLADAGDLKTRPADGPGNCALIASAAREIVAAGAVPVMIGGDDSTPIPFIAGLATLGPLTIVQVDAHIDWREERRGERFGFSSTMRRASEQEHVERIVQAGIRGIGSARRGEVEFARDWGAQIVTARTIHHDGIEAVLRHVPAGANCLITIDCDALDAGIMPAVMAPTPGGLSYTQAIDLVAGVARKARIVAFDMIEFVPERDANGTAAITAGRILANAIGAIARQ